MREKRKKIKNIILGAVTALAALAMALLPVLLRASRPGDKDAASILQTQVERGSIHSTISGGGALTGADARKISLPHGVEITRYLVKNGQSVTEGQPLAELDKASVMKTISVVQQNLDYLDKQLVNTPAAQKTGTIASPVSGRVKAVYAENGSRVSEVMLASGALAVISLDGRMAVQVETERDVAVGEDLTVTLPSGKELPGRVERRQENTLTVTLSDDGPALGDTVRLRTADGTELGEGELTIHSAWNLTAVSGVVKNIYIKPEQRINRGNSLCTLDEIEGNGRFDQLAAQRRDYEEALSQLFALYEAGVVAAPEDGIVAGIDTAKVGLVRAGGKEYSLVFLDNEEETPPPDPNTTSPSQLKNKAAVVSTVTFGSVSFLTGGDYCSVSSYAEAKEPDYAQAATLTLTSFAGVKVYRYDPDGQTWTQGGPGILEMGQLVYLVYDDTETLLWVLLPYIPEEEPEDYTGGGGGGWVEPPFEMYDLSQTEIMRLNPRGDMTVQVKIDEMDILFVAPGQEAEITVDALPGRSFLGRVREIDPQGVNAGGRTRYTVTITVDREEELLSGMNATAILTVGTTEDILTLPAAALVEKGSRTVVYTGYDPQSRQLLLPVEVETGISDGVSVEIVSGLAEGQVVFYSYYETDAMPELAALPGQLT